MKYQKVTVLHKEVGVQARSSKDPQCRFFARLAVAGLPRGGGDGDAIRHGILNVMRENGIKEGHRPVSLTSRVYNVTQYCQCSGGEAYNLQTVPCTANGMVGAYHKHQVLIQASIPV